MSEKYCFLDFDGVLTSTLENPGSYLTNRAANYGMSKSCMDIFMNFVRKHDVHVVISSNWRRFDPGSAWVFECEEYQNNLPKLVNILGDYYCGTLPPDRHVTKSEALAKWFQTHGALKPNQFVIFDDDMAEGFQDTEFCSNFIRTNYVTGLTEDDIEKAERIFNHG